MKHNFKSPILLSILILLNTLQICCERYSSLTTSNTNNTLSVILKTKIIKVGYVNFPPIIYKDMKSGKVTGHFALSIEEIAKQLEATCQYHEATWATFIAGLQNRQFDLSIAPTFSTIPRAASVAFSRPLMYVGNSAIIRKGENRFNSLQELDQVGIVIAVTQGEQGYEYAKFNIKKAKVSIQSQGDQTLAFSQVLAGRADIALGDSWAVSQFAKSHNEAIDLFADKPYNLTGVCWAVRADDYQLLHFINTSIEVLDSTGKIAEHEASFNAHWLHPGRAWVTY